MLGKPLHVDKLTASCRRISYARICVEVSAAHELQKSIILDAEDPIIGSVERLHLKVEYQWTPLRCSKCMKFGHDCARLPSAQKAPILTAISSSGPSARPSSSHRQSQDEGAWKVIEKGKAVAEIHGCIPSSSFKSIDLNVTSGGSCQHVPFVGNEATFNKVADKVSIPPMSPDQHLLSQGDLNPSIREAPSQAVNVLGTGLTDTNKFAALEGINTAEEDVSLNDYLLDTSLCRQASLEHSKIGHILSQVRQVIRGRVLPQV